MAVFKKILVTNKGRDLITKEIAGTTELTFTKVEASVTALDDSIDLTALSSLDGVRQAVNVSRVEKVGTGQVKITATFNNSGLSNGYSMETLGLYARDSAGTEVLFTVAAARVADYMPATNGINLSTVTIELIINISNTDKVSMSVDSSALVTVGMLETYYSTEEKHGIAKIYSESEADTDIEKIRAIVESGTGDEREFLGEDSSGPRYGESPWDKLIKILNHTKILTIKNAAKLIRKIMKPATENGYGLTTNANIKNLIRVHAPQPDLTPFVPFVKGYRNQNRNDFFIRTNGSDTWVTSALYMYSPQGGYEGKFHTNGGRAYYAVPGRNGGNFNEIMDNHDMAVRDNRMNGIDSNILQVRHLLQDVIVNHVREIRLAGYIVEQGANERNGYVVTFTNDLGNNTVQYGRRALQFYRNGQWVNSYFA